MTYISSISWKKEIYNSEKFQELIRAHLVSKTVNMLLIAYLDLDKNKNQKLISMEEMKSNLDIVNSHKAELLKQIEDLEEEAKKEARKPYIPAFPTGNDFFSKLTREKYFKENPGEKEKFIKKLDLTIDKNEETENVEKPSSSEKQT